MNQTQILFEVPEKYKEDLLKGIIKRVGALLINQINNKIVGHVQETSQFSNIITSIVRSTGNSPSIFLQMAQLGSSITQNIQLEHIKNSLSILKMFTSATLAVSALGIGINVVGFLSIKDKLNKIDLKLNKINSSLENLNKKIDRREKILEIQEQSKIEYLLSRAENAWSKSSKRESKKIWKDLEKDIEEQTVYYKNRILNQNLNILIDDKYSYEESLLVIERFLDLSFAHVQISLLIGENKCALKITSDFYDWWQKNIISINPVSIIDAKIKIETQKQQILNESMVDVMMKDQVNNKLLHFYLKNKILKNISNEEHVIKQIKNQVDQFSNISKEFNIANYSRVMLLKKIYENDIDGFEYIQSLKHENVHPFVVLPDDQPYPTYTPVYSNS